VLNRNDQRYQEVISRKGSVDNLRYSSSQSSLSALESNASEENLYDEEAELDTNEIISHSYQRSAYPLVLSSDKISSPFSNFHGSTSNIALPTCSESLPLASKLFEGDDRRKTLKNNAVKMIDDSLPVSIVLSCGLLLGLDASAIDTIEQIVLICKQNNCSLVFVALDESQLNLLQKANIFDYCSPSPLAKTQSITVSHTSDLNEALLQCEEQILANVIVNDAAVVDMKSFPWENNRIITSPDESEKTTYGQFISEEAVQNPAQLQQIDFYHCLILIQNKLSVKIDVNQLMKLAKDCVPLKFRRGETIHVHLSDMLLVRAKSTGALMDGQNSPFDRKSKKSLSKNVRGLFFLHRGYVSCESAKKAPITAADLHYQNSPLPLDDMAEQFHRLELSHTSSQCSLEMNLSRNNGKDNNRLCSQHGPGWVFGRLREGLKEGTTFCISFYNC